MTTVPDSRRLLRLAGKHRESTIISSFYFEAADLEELWPFVAGQYLTLEIPTSSGRPVLRTYTISSCSSDLSRYRITVKREGPTSDDVPPGVGSTYLHDILAPEGEIWAHRPRGDFILQNSQRPIVLLSGGVGLTPMVAMLAEMVANKSDRDIWFLHACRNSEVQALDQEVRALAARHARAHIFVFHEDPNASGGCDHAGRIDIPALKRILPFDDYEFYLCGPPPFMEALHEGLLELNISPDRIFYEFFGPARVLRRKSVPELEPDHAQISDVAAPLVEFLKSGKKAAWTGQQKSLLELAQSAGLDPMFSCGEGICGTCQCQLISGEIEYTSEPIAFIEGSTILPCIAIPKNSVAIDL